MIVITSVCVSPHPHPNKSSVKWRAFIELIAPNATSLFQSPIMNSTDVAVNEHLR